MNVTPSEYTVDAWAEMSGRRYLDIPFMHTYTHYLGGEGIYFMPEVGAPCWVCRPSERDKPAFVLGFGSAYDVDGTYKNFKRNLNAGDIFLGTRDDNFILLRRGGVLQLGGSGLSQRFHLPIGNWIKDFCESYQLATVGGELLWQVQRTEMDADGTQKIVFSLGTREQADDYQQVCTLTMGHHETDPNVACELVVLSDGTQSGAPKVTLTLKKTGEVVWDVQDAFNLTAVGDINLVSSGGNVVLKSESGTATLEGATSAILAAPAVYLGTDGVQDGVAVGSLVAAELAKIATAIGTLGGSYTPGDVASGTVFVES